MWGLPESWKLYPPAPGRFLCYPADCTWGPVPGRTGQGLCPYHLAVSCVRTIMAIIVEPPVGRKGGMRGDTRGLTTPQGCLGGEHMAAWDRDCKLRGCGDGGRQRMNRSEGAVWTRANGKTWCHLKGVALLKPAHVARQEDCPVWPHALPFPREAENLESSAKSPERSTLAQNTHFQVQANQTYLCLGPRAASLRW